MLSSPQCLDVRTEATNKSHTLPGWISVAIGSPWTTNAKLLTPNLQSIQLYGHSGIDNSSQWSFGTMQIDQVGVLNGYWYPYYWTGLWVTRKILSDGVMVVPTVS